LSTQKAAEETSKTLEKSMNDNSKAGSAKTGNESVDNVNQSSGNASLSAQKAAEETSKTLEKSMTDNSKAGAAKNSELSTQKAAEETSKTLEKSMNDNSKAGSAKNSETSTTKPAASSGEIAGIPKGVVDTVKKAVSATKEITGKAVDKISE
jgi:hypothetical protein